MRILSSITLLALLGSSCLAEVDPFLGENQKSGLVDLPTGDDMFYWLFRSRRDIANDALVMWLTGGPGCSSEMAVFFENGAFTINDDMSLKNNAYSWNAVSNIVFVDNPIGTGFSDSEGVTHLDRTEEEIAANMYIFLQGFLEQNPEFKGRNFYITGESYAGHYIPSIAYYLVNNPPLEMTFKGIAIGNGWVDPYNQYPAYAEFAYENDLISTSWYYMVKNGFAKCQDMIANNASHFLTLEYCTVLVDTILGNPLNPKFNVYDIRIPCELAPLCYDMSNADVFLNLPEIQAALGVSGRKWKECKTSVHMLLLGDWVISMGAKITDILEKGVEVLVYSGDKDYICNWRGGEAWTNAVDWSGKTDFNA